MVRVKLVVIAVLIGVFGGWGILQTQTWFFLRTGQAKIDFEKTSGEYDFKRKTAFFEGNILAAPPEKKDEELASRVLSESTGGLKRIEVDLTSQRLYAFEGIRKVFDFPISTGKPWWATPTGVFYPWVKMRYTRMSGGSQALGTYYDLPNVPFNIFFYNEETPQWKGYAVHGAYWHNDFGQTRSHGCVNVSPEDMEKLYYWADPPVDGQSMLRVNEGDAKTPIIIYGTTPSD